MGCTGLVIQKRFPQVLTTVSAVEGTTWGDYTVLRKRNFKELPQNRACIKTQSILSAQPTGQIVFKLQGASRNTREDSFLESGAHRKPGELLRIPSAQIWCAHLVRILVRTPTFM